MDYEKRKIEAFLRGYIVGVQDGKIIAKAETRCNNCDTYFESDDNLISLEDEDGYFLGCRNCRTDKYLMELEDE